MKEIIKYSFLKLFFEMIGTMFFTILFNCSSRIVTSYYADGTPYSYLATY